MTKLIVEMEMPNNCFDCPLRNGKSGYYCQADKDHRYVYNYIPKWCPIVGVLPDEHGDLIDRDAFIDKYITYYTEQERKMNLVFTAVEVKQQFADMICDEEVLISAEKNRIVQ